MKKDESARESAKVCEMTPHDQRRKMPPSLQDVTIAIVCEIQHADFAIVCEFQHADFAVVCEIQLSLILESAEEEGFFSKSCFLSPDLFFWTVTLSDSTLLVLKNPTLKSDTF